MISIRINGEERQYDESLEHWIHQQISRRRADNQTVCCIVTVHNDLLNMTLHTPGCDRGSSGSGGSRIPTAQEQAIFDLWDKVGLNGSKYTSGQLVAFLKQLRRNS